MTRKLISKESKKKSKTSWLIIALLLTAILFSISMTNHQLNNHGFFYQGTQNSANVLSPSISMQFITHHTVNGEDLPESHFINRWGLVYIAPTVCESSCIENISKMMLIKHLMSSDDEKFYVMVITSMKEAQNNPIYKMIQQHYPSLTYGVLTKKQFKQLFNALPVGTQDFHMEVLYLVNNHGEMIVSYPPSEAGNALLKDIKHRTL